jgi:putative colanic acid biosynthesis acetyltransferase WcaF
MNTVRLDLFSVGEYRPGATYIARILWYLLGQRLLRSQLLTSYSMKAALLRLFGAKVGKGVVIKPGVRVKYPWRLEVGDHVWIGEDAWIDNLDDVRIGSHVCLSQGVYLCTGNHDWKVASFDYRLSGIVVGMGAWIGAKSLVAPGVQVNEYAILAAGSVATRHLAPAQVYAGNPAIRVRDRWPSKEADSQRGSERDEDIALSRLN